MFQSVVFGNGRGALQTKIVGCKGGDGPAFGAGRSLRDDLGGIEDAAEDELVVCD